MHPGLIERQTKGPQGAGRPEELEQVVSAHNTVHNTAGHTHKDRSPVASAAPTEAKGLPAKEPPSQPQPRSTLRVVLPGWPAVANVGTCGRLPRGVRRSLERSVLQKMTAK